MPISLRKQKIRIFIRIFIGILLAITLAIASYFLYCPNPTSGLFPPAPNTKTRIVYLIQHEWHSGLAWAQQNSENFGAEELQDSPYIEVGWGDRQFYFENDKSIPSILRAAFIPSDSVMHVASFAEPPEKIFQFPIFKIELSELGFQKLFTYVKQTFKLKPQGDRLAAIGKGQYGVSNFYAAVPKYFSGFNCNTWAAEALRNAGVSVCPNRAFFAKNLADQVKAVEDVKQDMESDRLSRVITRIYR